MSGHPTENLRVLAMTVEPRRVTTQRIQFTTEMVNRIHAERAKRRPTPWARLADLLGVGTGTILRWAYEVGFPTDPRNLAPKVFADPAKSDRLRVLWADPTISQAEVCRRLDASDESVTREALRLELGPRPARVRLPKARTPTPRKQRIDPRAWPQAKLDKLRALVATDMSYTEIGLQLGISKSAAIGMSRRMGLERRPSPIIPGRKRTRVRRKPGDGRVIGPTLAVLPSKRCRPAC